MCPAQLHPDAGKELQHAEGLGHIVVGATVQPHHLVVLGALGSEHDDGDGGGAPVLTELFQNGEAVLLRQHDVQQHQLRHFLLHRLPELRGQREAPGGQALAVEGIDDEIPDAAVILQ